MGPALMYYMHYIALCTVVDKIKASDVWVDYARTADGEAERVLGNRKALKCKAEYIVGFDCEMDRLVKEYK